jgi:hypothetical protein
MSLNCTDSLGDSPHLLLQPNYECFKSTHLALFFSLTVPSLLLWLIVYPWAFTRHEARRSLLIVEMKKMATVAILVFTAQSEN